MCADLATTPGIGFGQGGGEMVVVVEQGQLVESSLFS